MPDVRSIHAWLAAGVVALAGCRDTTDPNLRRHFNFIRNIQLPPRAASGDTVRIGFMYGRVACDADPALEVRRTSDGLVFAATASLWSGPCAFTIRADTVRVGYLVLPPHSAPLRLTFIEPTGGDSVRVVAP